MENFFFSIIRCSYSSQWEEKHRLGIREMGSDMILPPSSSVALGKPPALFISIKWGCWLRSISFQLCSGKSQGLPRSPRAGGWDVGRQDAWSGALWFILYCRSWASVEGFIWIKGYWEHLPPSQFQSPVPWAGQGDQWALGEPALTPSLWNRSLGDGFGHSIQNFTSQFQSRAWKIWDEPGMCCLFGTSK